MKIKAYTCPSCGAPLDVNYDTTFTFCPHCGCKLHISYGDYYSHDTIRSSRITVENGEMVITDIA